MGERLRQDGESAHRFEYRLVTEQTGATAGFLEFMGHGLNTFEKAMDCDERLMAVLGSRLLESN